MAKRLNTEQAASYLEKLGTPFSPAALQLWRCQNKGPSYFRVNKRVFYEPSELRRFAAGQPVSTEGV